MGVCRGIIIKYRLRLSMKSKSQYRDWLHDWMKKMEPLTDDPKPDETTCRKIAITAGKMAARHGFAMASFTLDRLSLGL